MIKYTLEVKFRKNKKCVICGEPANYKLTIKYEKVKCSAYKCEKHAKEQMERWTDKIGE